MTTKFFQKVDKRNRKEMIDFLRGHARHAEGFGAGSYANNVKLRNLNIPADLEDIAYEVISDYNLSWSYLFLDLAETFEKDNKGFTVSWEGRSSGWFALYRSRNGLSPNTFGQDDVNFEIAMTEDLQSWVSIVQAFDQFCDDVVEEFIAYCQAVKEDKEQEPKEIDLLPRAVASLKTLLSAAEGLDYSEMWKEEFDEAQKIVNEYEKSTGQLIN